MHFAHCNVFLLFAVRWVLDWLAHEPAYKEFYTPEKRRKDNLKRLQLKRIAQQLGQRHRPLPDLQELIDTGRAMEAGVCIMESATHVFQCN